MNSIDFCMDLHHPQNSRSYTLSTNVVSFELNNQRTFSPNQIYVVLSCSTFLPKLNIISNLDPKIIKPIHLALQHYSFSRKVKMYLPKNVYLKIHLVHY